MEKQQKIEDEKIQQLTPEQKKTIWEWVKYLGKTLLLAIIKKLNTSQNKKDGN
jgi:hypothetical protein